MGDELKDILRLVWVCVLLDWSTRRCVLGDEATEHIDLVASSDSKRSTSDPNRVRYRNRGILAHVDVQKWRPAWRYIDVAQPLLAYQDNMVREAYSQDRLQISCSGPVKVLDGEALPEQSVESMFATHSNACDSSIPVENSLTFESQIVISFRPSSNSEMRTVFFLELHRAMDTFVFSVRTMPLLVHAAD